MLRGKTRVSEWLLRSAKWAICQIYHSVNNQHFNKLMMMSALHYANMLNWIFIVLAHWKNSRRVYISLHSDTFSWLRTNQSSLLLLITACLAGYEQIPNICLWFDPPELEPTLYHNKGENGTHYTTSAVWKDMNIG